MFKRLIANLPFNPGLYDQVSFYAARMRADASIRRVGFVFIALAFTVQLAAAMYPAEKSLATSPNDILDGLTTKSSILNAWDNNTGNVRAIYRKFGISRENIAAIPSEQPNYTIKTTDRNWWSIGRQPLNNFGISSKNWGERTINAEGNTVYQRPLKAWDNKAQASSYKAWHGINSQGKDFWIMQTCGNATFDGPYLPAAPKPKIVIHKTLLTSTTAHRGDTVKFRLEYQNTAPDSLATNFRLTDSLSSGLDFVSLDGISGRNGNDLFITHGGSLGYSANPIVSTLIAKIKPSASYGSHICNSASATSSETTAYSVEVPCLTVTERPAQPPHSPAPKSPAPASPPPHSPAPKSPAPSPPTGYCSATAQLASTNSRSVVVATTATLSAGAVVTAYSYDLGADGSIDYTDNTAENPHQRTIANLAPGYHKILVYTSISSSGGTGKTHACPADIKVAEDARVVLTKSVTNLTSHQANANHTTVNSGDQLEFRLTTENVTGTDYLNYKGQDYFGSVLQYADITNTGELAVQGVNITPDQNLVWTTAKLKAHSSEVKVIKVKVKNLVPSTNSPSKVSPNYNCTINNSYGTEVTMNVDCPIVKQAEVAAASLPNTGPGTSVLIGALAVVGAGYLFARSRLLAKELAIVQYNHVSTGGGI